ncbi:hypothetical protein PENSPDRAFT_756038 [Peniophora sp. CONT]|nr:hypothetical protein PENSPDRAFT_756038 [Peniophora sp. CONT]
MYAMDFLYPEKTGVFKSLVDDFTPTKIRPASTMLSSNCPSSQIIGLIEKDLARLDDVSRALRAERNSVVSLLRLPVEVIGNIIETCAHSDPPRPIDARKGHSASTSGAHGSGWLGWIRMSHVCQKLRRIMLEMPALWATIAFSVPMGHAEILLRARSVPLTVSLLRLREKSSIVKSAEAHLVSARVIRLDLGIAAARAMFEPVAAAPGKELGALEELRLSKKTATQVVTKDMVELSCLRAPRLRHLRLYNYFVPTTYSCLETLNLEYHRAPQLPRDPAHTLPQLHGDALLAMLCRCTSLRQLRLSGNLLAALPAPSPSRAAISLPSLQSLEMSGSAIVCRSVWSNLVVKPHARVAVTLSDVISVDSSQPIADDEDTVAFVPTLLRRLGESGAPDVTGVRLDYGNHYIRLAFAVTRVGTFTNERHDPFSGDRVFVLDLRLHSQHPIGLTAMFESLLSDLPTHVDLSKVDTLSITPPRLTSFTPEWRSWLASFHHVRNLVCDEFPPQRGLWEALCPLAGSVDIQPALPNLRTLFVLPQEWQISHNLRPTSVGQRTSWEDIPAGFIRRAKREAGIERVVLGTRWDPKRTVDAQKIEDIRAVVEHVSRYRYR